MYNPFRYAGRGYVIHRYDVVFYPILIHNIKSTLTMTTALDILNFSGARIVGDYCPLDRRLFSLGIG